MDTTTTPPPITELESLTKDPKATADFSEVAERTIAEADVLVKGGRTDEAIDSLLLVERQARQASDAISVSKIALKVLTICKESGNWKELNQQIVTLTKKRSQLKRAIVDIVQLCIPWIHELTDKDTKLALIDTLSQVTEGKIFVEVERARIVMILSKIKESEGDMLAAAALLEDVQVESFGAMEKREKAEYILEQMRVTLAKNDFVRCQIISKKINTKIIENEDMQDIKIKFNEYMIKYYMHETDYLNVAKCYRAIYITPVIQDDPEQWKMALQCYIIYLLLTEFCNEQSDLLHKVQSLEQKRLEELPLFKTLVSEVLTFELMKWPLSYESELRAHEVFTVHPEGDERWNLFRNRICQHNINTLAAYYDRIHIARVAHFLSVDLDEAEGQISKLVNSGYLKAKIDRLLGVVTFGGTKASTDRLNNWSTDIAKILDLVDESCHLVEKERMLQAAKAKRIQSLHKPAAEGVGTTSAVVH